MNISEDIKNNLKTLLIIFFALVIADGINSFFIPVKLASAREVEIQNGQSFRQIAQNLAKVNVIKNHYWFEGYALLKGDSRNLKAGRYIFEGKIKLTDVIRKLVNGESLPFDYEVLIPEGYTIYDIDRKLSEMKLIQASSFYRIASAYDNSAGRFEFLPKEKNVNLEGYLFPDTYRLDYDSKPEEIIEKMLVNFRDKVFDQYFSAKNFKDVIIMASIIQKEVPDPEEMKFVSGILWKRLKIKMPLQADATLYYFKCYINPPFECSAINKQDKITKSGYNTYLNKGLPIGPISNPGLNAIEAAAKPSASSYLYYLSARKDGKTIFAKTLDEHNQNIYKYR